MMTANEIIDRHNLHSFDILGFYIKNDVSYFYVNNNGYITAKIIYDVCDKYPYMLYIKPPINIEVDMYLKYNNELILSDLMLIYDGVNASVLIDDSGITFIESKKLTYLKENNTKLNFKIIEEL